MYHFSNMAEVSYTFHGKLSNLSNTELIAKFNHNSKEMLMPAKNTLFKKIAYRHLIFIFFTVTSSLSIAQNSEHIGSESLRETLTGSEKYSVGATPSWVKKPSNIKKIAKYDEDPAYIKYIDTQINLTNKNKQTFILVHSKINKSQALDYFGKIDIEFMPDYHEVELHKISIIRDGKEIEKTKILKPKFFQRETELDQGIYNGGITANFIIDDLRTGDEVIYAYSVTGSNPVFNNKFTHSSSWNSSIPILKKRVILNHPINRKITHKLLFADNGFRLSPKSKTSNGIKTLTWEKEDLPEAEYEQLMSKHQDPKNILQMSEYSNWQEVANWGSQLFKNKNTISKELVAEIGNLKKINSKEDQIRAALDLTQEKIRYLSLSFNESSHRPQEPNLVFKNRFGDCKDKSLLLISILKELGIEAYPVLLSTTSGQWINKILATPSFFDHAIVAVKFNNTYYYLDPTSSLQKSKLNYMSQTHQDTPALILEPNKNHLTTIKSPNYLSKNGTKITTKYKFNKLKGKGTLYYKQEVYGVYAEILRESRKAIGKQEFEESIFSSIKEIYPNAKRNEPQLYEEDIKLNKIIITENITSDDLIMKDNDNYYVKLMDANELKLPKIPQDRKNYAHMTSYFINPTAEYNYEVEFPDQVSAMDDPKSTEFQNELIDFTSNYNFRGNQASASYKIVFKEPAIKNKDFDKYNMLAEKINASVDTYIYISSYDIGNSRFTSKNENISEKMFNQSTSEIQQLTNTIESGEFSGRDLANAYYFRAITKMDIKNGLDVLRDIEKALEIDPKNTKYINAKAKFYLRTKKYTRAIETYSYSLIIGGDPETIYRERGMSFYLSNQYSNARDDFSKLKEISTDNFTELWLIWSFLADKKPLPKDIIDNISDDLTAPWPLPARALFTDQLTSNNVLSLADNKTEDEKTLFLCEAYFYIAQLYLINNQKEKAKEYLQKVVDTKIYAFYEYMIAQNQLSEL